VISFFFIILYFIQLLITINDGSTDSISKMELTNHFDEHNDYTPEHSNFMPFFDVRFNDEFSRKKLIQQGIDVIDERTN
jgi:hypothetical protein